MASALRWWRARLRHNVEEGAYWAAIPPDGRTVTKFTGENAESRCLALVQQENAILLRKYRADSFAASRPYGGWSQA